MINEKIQKRRHITHVEIVEKKEIDNGGMTTTYVFNGLQKFSKKLYERKVVRTSVNEYKVSIL